MIFSGEISLVRLSLGFHLDTHLNLQILELRCLSHFWERLLGCGMSLKWPGFCVAVVASCISMKLPVGGVVISCVLLSISLITFNMNLFPTAVFSYLGTLSHLDNTYF